jgi:hypothetical protein
MPQFHEEVGLAEAVRDLARAGGFAMPALHRTDDFISAAVLAAAGRGVVLAPPRSSTSRSTASPSAPWPIMPPPSNWRCSAATTPAARVIEKALAL